MSCNNDYLNNSPCAKSIGGIKRGWYAFFGDIAFAMNFDDIENTSKYFEPEAISSLYLKPSGHFYEFITKPDKVTITENITVDETVGSDTTTTEIVIKQSDMLSAAVAAFKKSASAEFVFLFEDMQGRYFIYGIDKPVKLSSATVESGNVIGDFNGGTFTFTTDGVLSRFWTKYEAENGDFSSNYINVKTLLNGGYNLKASYNLQNTVPTIDTGHDFNFIDVTSSVAQIDIVLNFDDEHLQPGHQDRFYINNTLGENIWFDNDEMYKPISYYFKKGLDFEDKKEFTFIYQGDPTQELLLEFSDGVSARDLASLEFNQNFKVIMFKGYVTFNRSAEQGGNEDVFTINQIYYK